MGDSLDERIKKQIEKAGLPRAGPIPFEPALKKNRRGRPEVQKSKVTAGPKRGKKGYLDATGRIWVRDRAHGGQPDHWDVQIDGGKRYLKVDFQGNRIQ
ncbi:MAG: hypothetical protein HYX69_00660 [Planctomycetia bacterium]|nr:hypothetical protein [Planctomycetia bacterium]